MATSAIGGFAAGLAGGLKLGQELNESEQRRKLALEQAERDKTRFEFEKEEAEDKSSRRKKVKATRRARQDRRSFDQRTDSAGTATSRTNNRDCRSSC